MADVAHRWGLQVELWKAVYRCDADEVLSLIEKGADIEDREGFGSTKKDGGGALHWAVLYGSAEVVFTLLVRGAELGRLNRHGHSPMKLAEMKCKHENARSEGTFELYELILTILMEEYGYRLDYTLLLRTPPLAEDIFAKHETFVLEALPMSRTRMFLEQSAIARLHVAYPEL
ncbi:hypothetical protein T484DRAFT_1757120 [Baffinella frigidus]|nr:hypothetical protein T484DRAFT_1757120 [Cryptophyta sp. CCMP2293]